MTQTENLDLKIIEGTDIPSFAPFNENMNKIDAFAKTTSDSNTSQNLQLESLNTDVTTLKQHDETNTTNITNLTNKVDLLMEAVSEIEVKEGDTVKKGKLHTAKFLIEPTVNSELYAVQQFGVESLQETRVMVGEYDIHAQLNATELFGINDVSKIDFISCTSLAKGYYNYAGEANPMPLNLRTLAVVTPSGSNDIMLELYNSIPTVMRQTYHEPTQGGWLPAAAAYQQKGKVTIMLQYITYE